MNFGQALELLKSGDRVARSGWNGKGMFLAHQAGYPDGIPINNNTAKATGIPEGTVCKFHPYIIIKTTDGAFVPWLASQTDLLAEDWILYNQKEDIMKKHIEEPNNNIIIKIMHKSGSSIEIGEDIKIKSAGNFKIN
ncbi:hypothetical protein C4A75_00220 [Brevibacillus laterosporus]|uniref:DUF2829 domain-containing protein n=1 Tax=Brevibacillus laterosporus TaxID=1465 RepID=UPI000CE42601|nr:DUF2829 domain-containing protein [Brevibacillus laterosporus]PPA87680.1 hypothetical protein C4A75_00220 [Brevibacillus laterosporus]